jgi:hypothetical protein
MTCSFLQAKHEKVAGKTIFSILNLLSTPKKLISQSISV